MPDRDELPYWMAFSSLGGATRHAHIALQVAHVTGAEYVAHQAGAFVHVEGPTFRCDDAGRILAAMLQQLQAVIQQLVNRCLRYYAENTAHKSPY